MHRQQQNKGKEASKADASPVGPGQRKRPLSKHKVEEESEPSESKKRQSTQHGKRKRAERVSKKHVKKESGVKEEPETSDNEGENSDEKAAISLPLLLSPRSNQTLNSGLSFYSCGTGPST